MKFTPVFKRVLFFTLLAIVLTGIGVWVLGTWFQIDHGLGAEPRTQLIWFIRGHALAGLWFLFIFGYLFHSHVLRGWRAKRKLGSGLTLLIPLIVLCATVPALYYLTDEATKSLTATIHTYLGLAVTLPFFIHWLKKPT